jgi:hypothetical protein
VKSGYKVYMKLRIRNVQKEDFMEYRCVAKNSLGGSDGTITLYEVQPPTTSTTTTTTETTPTTTTTRLHHRVTLGADRKGNRRRKYRNRKNREKKLHNKDQQLKEYNGAGKLVEDHISVRIEEEKESVYETFSPRNSGCQSSMFLSNILHSCGSRLVSNLLWIYSWYESSSCM